jgi:hypothetical protein
VTARVTKHLCFSFQPTDRILNEKLFVFPFEGYGPFAVLQSRVHTTWAWLLSSTMKNDLNYSASECFETFPLPPVLETGQGAGSALEDIGERLYLRRARYMAEARHGLTVTYNRLRDPACDEGAVVELRGLHEEMDRVVLDSYGWLDVSVPPVVRPSTRAERQALETFEDEIIDRLFALNAERAVREQAQGKEPDRRDKEPVEDGGQLTLEAFDAQTS